MPQSEQEGVVAADESAKFNGFLYSSQAVTVNSEGTGSSWCQRPVPLLLHRKNQPNNI